MLASDNVYAKPLIKSLLSSDNLSLWGKRYISQSDKSLLQRIHFIAREQCDCCSDAIFSMLKSNKFITTWSNRFIAPCSNKSIAPCSNKSIAPCSNRFGGIGKASNTLSVKTECVACAIINTLLNR